MSADVPDLSTMTTGQVAGWAANNDTGDLVFDDTPCDLPHDFTLLGEDEEAQESPR